jgi:hypothetical protein
MSYGCKQFAMMLMPSEKFQLSCDTLRLENEKLAKKTALDLTYNGKVIKKILTQHLHFFLRC